MDLISLIQNEFVMRGIGIAGVFFLSYGMSSNRKKIQWKYILFIFMSIWIFAYFFMYSFVGVEIISRIAYGVDWLYEVALEGTKFLFGGLVDTTNPLGFIFAFRVLPMIIFFSALTAVLYYLGIIQWIVSLLGILFRPLFGTTGPETMCAIGNSFLSQTEAPLLIRSYLKGMTESEIFVVMVSGMATISSSLLAVYSILGIPLKHLLISSILSIPSSICIAKIMVPPTGKESAQEKMKNDIYKGDFFSVLATGTADGLFLALHVGAMLLVVISLLYLINNALTSIGIQFGFFDFGLNTIFSYIMWPAAWAMGIPWNEIMTVAGLLGNKIAVNEMVAYLSLAKLSLSTNTIIYATYALCGFSNFSCIGIQIGSIGNMEASIKPTMSRLGLKALCAAVMVNLMTAYIIGFFL